MADDRSEALKEQLAASGGWLRLDDHFDEDGFVRITTDVGGAMFLLCGKCGGITIPPMKDLHLHWHSMHSNKGLL